MSSAIGIFAIGLMVVVLLISIFSLVVLAIIPIGRYLERRADRSPKDPSPEI